MTIQTKEPLSMLCGEQMRVGGWHWQTCGRPVVEGDLKCRLHCKAAVDKRNVKSLKAYEDRVYTELKRHAFMFVSKYATSDDLDKLAAALSDSMRYKP